MARPSRSERSSEDGLSLAARLGGASQLIRSDDEPVLAATRSLLMDLCGRIVAVFTSPRGPALDADGRAFVARLEAFVTRVELAVSNQPSLSAQELGLIAEESAQLEASTIRLLTTGGRARASGTESWMKDLAAEYGEDARRAHHSASRYRRLGLAAWIGAIALATGGLLGSYFGRPKTGGVTFFYQCLLVAAVIALAATSVLVVAERARRSAEESVRLQRQLATVKPYLDPFPDGARTLMRATLAPRLFSRMPGEEDPIQTPLWPTAEEILRSSGAAGGVDLDEPVTQPDAGLSSEEARNEL